MLVTLVRGHRHLACITMPYLNFAEVDEPDEEEEEMEAPTGVEEAIVVAKVIGLSSSQ